MDPTSRQTDTYVPAGYEYLVVWFLSMNYIFQEGKEHKMILMTKKENALKAALNIEQGEVRIFPQFAIALSKHNGHFIIHWKKGFHERKQGTGVMPFMLNNSDDVVFFCNYDYYWSLYPSVSDWDDELYNKVMCYITQTSGCKEKQLKFRYYSGKFDMNEPLPSKETLFKPKYRNITNKNLCKIDGLNLKGNVDYIYGIIATDRLVNFHDETVIISTSSLLNGTISECLYGDISGVIGTISDELTGDISGITGNVTNVYGDCTGIVFNIKRRVEKRTHIKALIKTPLSGKLRLLSNEDSEKSFNAYRKLAHCTLGLTPDERKAINTPIKIKPPFNIDKWGRHYTEKDRFTWVYSINPADIMFLKEIGPLNSCFCITSQSADGRWHSAMRTLMALNCTNPSLACVFKISNEEPVRRMRMFKNLDFMWFKPIEGGFFQYNEKGQGKPWSSFGNSFDVDCHFAVLEDSTTIVPIHGHDGINVGHNRQKEMAYLELFIKDEHSWVQDKDWIEKSANIITNNHWDICYDENWNELNRCGDSYGNADIPENSVIESFIKEAQMAKEIIDGIKV